MSQTITSNILPIWMKHMLHPSNGSFEKQIFNKIDHKPHYPGPIHNIGGLYVGSHCRIPGVQPLIQPILRPKTCVPHCLTKYCFEYGNTHFPPQCGCDEKHDCRSYQRCDGKSNCSLNCGRCNHNSNVIYF